MNKLFFTVSAAFLFGTTSVSAATVTTTAFAQVSVDGAVVNTDTDTNTDATSTAVASPVSSTVNVDGSSFVRGGATLASGENPARYIGSATYAIEETNTTGATQDYEVSFTLNDIIFDLNGDFGGANAGPNPFTSATVEAVGARFSYQLFLNGSELYFAGAQVFGGSDEYFVESAINANVTRNGFDQVSDFATGDTGARFEVDEISDSFAINGVVDGETFNLEALYTVELLFNGFENAAYVNFVDPVSLSLATLTQTTNNLPGLAPIPLPAAGWMLIAGVGGLIVAGRRKTA